MIVRTTRVKVGHRQAPLKSPRLNRVWGFCFAGCRSVAVTNAIRATVRAIGASRRGLMCHLNLSYAGLFRTLA